MSILLPKESIIIYDIKREGDILESIIIENKDINKIVRVQLMIYDNNVIWDSLYNENDLTKEDNKLYIKVMVNLLTIYSQDVQKIIITTNGIEYPIIKGKYILIDDIEVRRKLARVKAEKGYTNNWWRVTT